MPFLSLAQGQRSESSHPRFSELLCVVSLEEKVTRQSCDKLRTHNRFANVPRLDGRGASNVNCPVLRFHRDVSVNSKARRRSESATSGRTEKLNELLVPVADRVLDKHCRRSVRILNEGRLPGPPRLCTCSRLFPRTVCVYGSADHDPRTRRRRRRDGVENILKFTEAHALGRSTEKSCPSCEPERLVREGEAPVTLCSFQRSWGQR